MRGMRRFSIGLTRIEAMTVLAVISVLAASVAPSFENRLRARRLSGTASQLVEDLRNARSEAVLRNAGIKISFAASSYSMRAAPPGSITLRTVDWGQDDSVISDASVVVTYAPRHSTAAILLASAARLSNGANSIQLGIHSMGRVQCAPISGTAKC